MYMSIANRYAMTLTACHLILSMKTIEETRHARLKILVEEVGSVAALNRAAGRTVTDSTFSQILNRAKESKTGNPRGMGSAMARQLEIVSNKPLGWMDNDPDLESSWPFEDSVPLRRFQQLTPNQQKGIEDAVRRQVDAFLGEAPTKSSEEKAA